MPDAEKRSVTNIREETFFYTVTYQRIETTSIEYMKSSETLEVKDVRKVIKWHRVAGILLMVIVFTAAIFVFLYLS